MGNGTRPAVPSEEKKERRPIHSFQARAGAAATPAAGAAAVAASALAAGVGALALSDKRSN